MHSYHLHFIRHAQTIGNQKGQFIGSTDLPATPEGLREIESFLKKGIYPFADRVYASPLLRCRQTASTIYPDTPITILPQFKEYDFGDYEGKTLADLKGEPHLKSFLSTSQEIGFSPPPGGEDPAAFSARIFEGLNFILDDLLAHSLFSAAIVTHGGVIAALLSAFGLPKAPMTHWMVNNGCGYTAITQNALWTQNHLMEVYEAISPSSRGEGLPDEDDYLDYAESLLTKEDLIDPFEKG